MRFERATHAPFFAQASAHAINSTYVLVGKVLSSQAFQAF